MQEDHSLLYVRYNPTTITQFLIISQDMRSYLIISNPIQSYHILSYLIMSYNIYLKIYSLVWFGVLQMEGFLTLMILIWTILLCLRADDTILIDYHLVNLPMY